MDRTQRLWNHSRGGIGFFASGTRRILVFATRKKRKGEEEKEEGLDKIETDWGRVEIITRECASATLRVEGIKGWDRPRGNSARAPRRSLHSREAEANKKD